MKKLKRVSTQVHTRKLDRLVDHARMKKADLKHVNRHDYSVYKNPFGMTVQQYIGSYFSKHWREVAYTEMKNM